VTQWVDVPAANITAPAAGSITYTADVTVPLDKDYIYRLALTNTAAGLKSGYAYYGVPAANAPSNTLANFSNTTYNDPATPATKRIFEFQFLKAADATGYTVAVTGTDNTGAAILPAATTVADLTSTGSQYAHYKVSGLNIRSIYTVTVTETKATGETAKYVHNLNSSPFGNQIIPTITNLHGNGDVNNGSYFATYVPAYSIGVQIGFNTSVLDDLKFDLWRIRKLDANGTPYPDGTTAWTKITATSIAAGTDSALWDSTSQVYIDTLTEGDFSKFYAYYVTVTSSYFTGKTYASTEAVPYGKKPSTAYDILNSNVTYETSSTGTTGAGATYTFYNTYDPAVSASKGAAVS
jgi:hypothetical protein